MELGDPSSSLKVFLMRMGGAVFAAIFILRGRVILPQGKIFYGLAAFLIACSAPAIYSPNFPTSFIGIYPFYSSSTLSVFCILFFFIFACSLKKKDILILFRIIISAAFLVSIYGIIQYAGVDFLSWKGNFYPRIWSTLGNPNFLAAYLAMILPLAVYQYASASNRWRGGIVFMVIACAILMTSSRAGILSAVSGSFFTVMILKRDSQFKERIKLLGIFIIIIIVVIGVINFSRLADIGSRYLSAFDLKENNIAARIIQWNTGLRMFFERPILGRGINSFYMYFRRYMSAEFFRYSSLLSVPGYPHNYIIKILIDGGIVFSVFIFGWWILVFLHLYRDRRKANGIIGAILGSFLALWVQNMFSFSIITTWIVLWTLIGAGIAVSGRVIRIDISSFSLRYLFLIPIGWLAVFSFGRLYGDHLFYKGRYREAVKRAPEVSKYRMFYGKKLFLEGKYEEAKNIFEEQIKSTSYLALPYNGLGSVYLKKNDYRNAIVYFKQALKRDPFLLDSHIKIGLCLRENGDFNNAAHHYKFALNLKPELIDPRYNLGVIYFKQEKYRDALDHWEKVLQYNPEHEMAKKNIRIVKNKISIEFLKREQ